jgi:enamine deaminase RidA (YjgF/YER057c/UK114 family)
MNLQLHNPENLFPPYRNYSHAVQVSGNSSFLFISGLNGYLSNGSHAPARTVICSQLLDKRWKLEIEAVAAK